MLKKKPQNIRVIKNVEKPETPEILASAIIDIANGFNQLCRAGSLSQKAVAVLLKGMPGMSHLATDDIILVLDNMPKLSSYYIRK